MTALDQVRAAVGAVVDPEMPALTIADLGILRDVADVDGRLTVTITPTYLGCPALAVITEDIRAALSAVGHPEAEVRTQLSPPWTSDWITVEGRAKLSASGIAPPAGSLRILEVSGRHSDQDLPRSSEVACPVCGSPRTVELSRFAATACQALWRCRDCGEPFGHVKQH